MVSGTVLRVSLVLAGVAGVGTVGAGCASDLAVQTNGLVYDSDDRQEYFEVDSELARTRMAQSMVALIPRAKVRRSGGGLVLDAPTWGAAAKLCADEPFFDQPAAAFCTGVLVDWDLVLTAGHCVRVLASEDYVIAFDYHYVAPGLLALRGNFARVVEILDERLDPPGTRPRLDYAWLRIDPPARPPQHPTSIHTGRPLLAAGAAVISIGAGGGVAMKFDPGGKVADPGDSSGDYFVATTDTSHGSSGGGAFDEQMALFGVLARGEPDLAPTDAGCNATVRVTGPTTIADAGLDASSGGQGLGEQYTYTAGAVAGLCHRDAGASSICRADCGEPCLTLAQPPATRDAEGCAIGSAGRGRPGGGLVAMCIASIVFLTLRAAGRRSAVGGRRARRGGAFHHHTLRCGSRRPAVQK